MLNSKEVLNRIEDVVKIKEFIGNTPKEDVRIEIVDGNLEIHNFNLTYFQPQETDKERDIDFIFEMLNTIELNPVSKLVIQIEEKQMIFIEE